MAQKILANLKTYKFFPKYYSIFSLKKSKPNPYLIMRATSDDYPKMLDLMWETYFMEEPTCQAIGITPPNSLLEDLTLKALGEGISVVAKCKYTGSIVGGCINETTNPWDPDDKDRLACNINCPLLKHLLHFYAHVQRKPELWQKFCLQKVFEMSNLFVKRDERGKGLALKLMDYSRSLAADCGYQLVRVDATSHYTALLCEKMQMKLIDTIPYCSYVDKDNEPIFRPAMPHEYCKIYIDDNPFEKRKLKK